MFDDFTSYPKPKVKLFFKYLVNSASRIKIEPEIKRVFLAQSPYVATQISQDISEDSNYEEHEFYKKNEAEKEKELGLERKEELETKIKIYFAKNRYSPFETRLKSIKDRYRVVNRSQKINKKKQEKIKTAIKTCEEILKTIEKVSVLKG